MIDIKCLLFIISEEFDLLTRSNLVAECDQSTNSRWQSGSLKVLNLSQRLTSKCFKLFFYFALFDKKKVCVYVQLGSSDLLKRI